MPWNRGTRSTLTPSDVELDVRAIPVLRRGGWKLCSLEEVPLIGSAAKNYVSFGVPLAPNTLGYIAKKARRAGDLECVTEEMISRIGRLLPLSIADSRLVRLPGTSPPDIRFMSRNFLRRDKEQLLHGAELVANYLDTSKEEVSQVFRLDNPREERRFYTVEVILEVLHWWGRTPDERRDLQDAFGRMLAFDALVGAPDRHALNWAGIQSLRDDRAPRIFAPIYDTARGLFCEHRENRLVDIDKSAGGRRAYIERYAEKSCPVIGCGGPGGDCANHFRLIEYCVSELTTELGAPIRKLVHSFGVEATEKMLRRNFTRIITKRRMEWILELLQVRLRRLKEFVE